MQTKLWEGEEQSRKKNTSWSAKKAQKRTKWS